MSSRTLQDARSQAAFVVGSWTAVPGANELIAKGGVAVRVEPRAMDVLVLLHARRGEVVFTDEILDRVWGGAAVSGHSVAIVVSDLRKALGDDPRKPRFLETVPKRGYRLRAERGAGVPPDHPKTSRRAHAVLAAAVIVVAAGGVLSGWAARRAPAPDLDRFTAEKYFQARQLWSRRDPETARRARALLEEVIATRADFAPAHAALADVYAHKTGEYLGLPALEAFRAAEGHVDRALALDPRLAEPWVSRALLDFYRDRQPRQALASLGRALDREPRLALAWQTRAMVLSAIGAHTESLRAIERAAALDPLSPSVAWDRVWFLHLAGRQDDALFALEQASVHSPRNLFYEALIEEARGRKQRALEAWLDRFARRGVALADPAGIREVGRRSMPEAYRVLLDQIDRAGAEAEITGVLLAVYRLLAGDTDGALTALEHMPPDHLWMRAWLHELPVLQPLATHPRMRAVVAREGIAGPS